LVTVLCDPFRVGENRVDFPVGSAVAVGDLHRPPANRFWPLRGQP